MRISSRFRKKTSILTLAICLLSFTTRGISQEISAIDTVSLAEEVRQEFLRSWNAYKQYAWGHDELRPLSKSAYDWYSTPFLMTPVDALDTMILMGFKEEADSTREYIATHLSFDKDVYVKNFEFTIRFLGGLVSSYQLTRDKRLLRLAQDLGNRLLPAFNSRTGMPYVYVNLKTGAVRDSISNPAEIGTLLLEFGTLSTLTGDSRYLRAAKYALLQLYSLRSGIGLVGDAIDVTTGEWIGTDSHIGGAIDSYYEYLLKCALLFNDEECRMMWRKSIASVRGYLPDRAVSGKWYGHADMFTGKRTKTVTGALDAFFPAVLVLNGDIDEATELEDAFVAVWKQWGVEPDGFDYSRMTVVDSAYYLRPEIIESAYYLFAKTGNPRFRRMGEEMFESLKAICRTDEAYAELTSVVTREKGDRMQSFFLAETLKYLYLLFAPPETLSFKNNIFNTEAHPIRKLW
jgi:mannosidase alpha-like ER degradation enhancer 2